MKWIDGFMLSMLGAVVLGLLVPGLGASDGPLHLDVVTRIGISAVFFLHGASLSFDKLKAGVGNWRLHTLVQVTTFVLFPACGFALFFATAGLLPDGLRLGLFYLTAVGSTISSSVALTGLAGGNVAGGVFNATLSSLMGLVVTPLLVGAVGAMGGHGLDLGKSISDVAIQLLLPFAAGQLARPLLKDLLVRHKPLVSRLDRAVIVLIVFSAFSDSTANGLWSRYSPSLLIIVALIAAALFGLALAFIRLVTRRLGFTREDEVAAVFCGSQKSLASGAPTARILFAGSPDLSLIMLPLMFYHQLQLMVCSALARRYAEAGRRDATASANIGAADATGSRT